MTHNEMEVQIVQFRDRVGALEAKAGITFEPPAKLKQVTGGGQAAPAPAPALDLGPIMSQLASQGEVNTAMMKAIGALTAKVAALSPEK